MKSLSRFALALTVAAVVATPAWAVWTRFAGSITASSLVVTGGAAFQGSVSGFMNSVSSRTLCAQTSYPVSANFLNAGVSTITYTSKTGRVRVHFNANRIQSSNSGSATRSSVLLNGQHIAPYSNSQGPGGGIDTVTHSWNVNVATTANVSHSFALVVGSDGNININLPVAAAAPNGDRSCALFYVEDIP
jgi:hypothetical protein